MSAAVLFCSPCNDQQEFLKWRVMGKERCLKFKAVVFCAFHCYGELNLSLESNEPTFYLFYLFLSLTSGVREQGAKQLCAVFGSDSNCRIWFGFCHGF